MIDCSGVPASVRDYWVPSYQLFAFFPWAAFLAFGVSAGSVLKSITAEQLNCLMQWSAIIGFGLLVGGRFFANLPYTVYPKSKFWLDSPWQVACKLGSCCLSRRLRICGASTSCAIAGLGAPARHNVPVGLLGAHRTGLRQVAVVLQRLAEQLSGGRVCSRRYSADARAVGAENPVARTVLAHVDPGFPSAQPAARFGRLIFDTVIHRLRPGLRLANRREG